MKELKSKCTRKRCIRQFVLIAEKNAKFLSNQQKEDQSTVEIVIESMYHKEEGTNSSFRL